MTNNKPNQATVIETCTKRINALKAHVDAKTVIAMNGVPTKVSDVLAIYQSCLDNRATLNTQRAEVKATLATVASADSKRKPVEQSLKRWVIDQYGADSTVAHDFGYSLPKVPAKSVDTKAQALVRGKATRAARHTMGSRQKEKVKGTMVVLVPPGNPATTVQAAAPAASTSNGTSPGH
jgi:hypothetical protein